MNNLNKQKMWALAAVFVLLAGWLSAQTVRGVVKDATGAPLPGVNIVVKGTNAGTVSDYDGKYGINAGRGATLVFSYIGYLTQEKPVGDAATIDVVMQDDTKQLSDVVVTALGVERSAKTLTYSTQKVDGDELSRTRDANVINALAGKSAGVTITRSASGVGGSTKVLLRGNRSIRENQPLYVIDGVPMNNATPAQPSDVWGQSDASGLSGRDGGDGIGNLNPDDIESINVLKGASAAALYGSQAANGVIVITTKKGKLGKTRVDFSSNYTLETPLTRPELQYSYAQTKSGAADSWGAKKDGISDHVSDFFRTGGTWINSLSLSGGNNTAQTYFSYSNTSSDGILPTNTFNRHTLNLRETARFFDDRLSVDANVILAKQDVKNRPSSGLYYNPLTGLYLLPRGLDFNTYKNQYEILRPSRNVLGQNWFYDDKDAVGNGEDLQQNPYWILNRNVRDENRNRVFSSITARYDINNWMYLQARGSIDKTYDVFEQKAYATTQSTLADPNGRYTLSNSNSTQTYGDLILNVARNFNGFGFNGLLGTSINDLNIYSELFDSKGGNLRYANEFSLQNMLPGGTIRQAYTRRQLQSVFANLQFSYRNMVYLDVTGRNDWSSALAFTSTKSYFYPSVGLTTILSEMVKLPTVVDFAKLRVSYAQVGNDVPPYVTNPLNTVSFATGLTFNNVKPFSELKPELSRSLEVGTEWRFLKERLTLDLTWYKTNTINQFFILQAPLGSSYSSYYVNAGNVENTGVELTLGLVPVKNGKLTWNTNFNFTLNRNKILELHPDLKGEYALTGPGVNNYGLYLREGGSFGDIYGKVIKKDANGNYVVDATGAPIANKSTLEYVGNPNPKFLLGWNNSVSFGKFTVNLLIDTRVGGKVMSITEAMLDERGVSQRTADARNAGGVDIKAVKEDGTAFSGKIPADVWYKAIGGRAGFTGEYLYDATNVRLRELAIGYSFGKAGVFKNINLSFVSRNLFFFYKKAPYDPELSMSTGNGLQGVDVFSIPATRSFGLNLKVSL